VQPPLAVSQALFALLLLAAFQLEGVAAIGAAVGDTVGVCVSSTFVGVAVGAGEGAVGTGEGAGVGAVVVSLQRDTRSVPVLVVIPSGLNHSRLRSELVDL
jgi:hypothetical protein